MCNKTKMNVLLFALINFSSAGQPLTIQWQKCLGGSLGEAGYSIKQTADGGYVTCGIAVSSDGDVMGNHDVSYGDGWVVKLDSFGNIAWQRCYGGTVSEVFYSICLIENGDFVLAGTTSSVDGDLLGVYQPGPPGSEWILKCDSTGSILWQKCIGGSGDEGPYKVIRTYDNGFAVIGITDSDDYDVVDLHDSINTSNELDAWLVKLDSIGNIEWSKCYGGYSSDWGYSIMQTPDSGFVFAGTPVSVTGDLLGIHGLPTHDYWIVKVNSVGTIQWQKCFGGLSEEIPNDIALTRDNGFIITGIATSNDFDVVGHHGTSYNKDVWIVKLDSIGNMQWQKCLGGSFDEHGRKIIQLSDGGYLTLNYTESSDGDLLANPPSLVDVWIAKLDSFGNILWQQCFGGTSLDGAYDMEITSDGGVVFTGLTASNDGDVSGNHGDYDVWVVKLAPLPNSIAIQLNPITDFAVYQNPVSKSIDLSFYANGNEDVNVQLIDLTGRVLIQQPLAVSAGFNRKQVQTDNISAGVYLVRLMSEGGGVTKKIMVQ